MHPHPHSWTNWDVSMQQLNNLERRNNYVVDCFGNFHNHEPCWGLQVPPFNQSMNFPSNKSPHTHDVNFARKNCNNGDEYFARTNMFNGRMDSSSLVSYGKAQNYGASLFGFNDHEGKYIRIKDRF